MKTIQPLGEMILLTRYVEEKKAGMLIVPNSDDKSDIFTILALGEKVGNHLSIGNNVLLKKYSSQGYKIGDQEFFLVHLEDILAKVLDA